MPRLILGHTTDHSVRIWVRGSDRWPFAFIDLFDAANKSVGKTVVIETLESEFFTAVAEWDGLSADSPYRVKVAFGKSKKSKDDERVRDAYTEGRFHTFPKPSASTGFTFLLGSCNLHSTGFLEKPDRAWIQISRLAKLNEARFMIHCGDQIYADVPLKPSADFGHYRDKYLDAWDDCTPTRKVLTELPHYMILDDHEIINNFDNDLTSGNIDYQGLARVAMKAYWLFQHSHNPQSPLKGRHYHYDFAFGKVRFFALDFRFYRYSDSGQMIDPAQEAALLQWLSTHKKDLKFIITSIPFVTEVKSPKKDKWCDPAYDGQRGRILQHLLDQGIEKVVFLTGDMHAALHATLEVQDDTGRTTLVHELMSSPINQITPDWEVERQFLPGPTSRKLEGGPIVTSSIAKASYFAKHSNVMAIAVDETGEIHYRVYRTTSESTSPLKERSFNP